MLQPKALGGKPTPLKNDPIQNNDILIDGIKGFVELRKDTKFSIDFSGFASLVDSSYKAMITCDRGLAKFISANMFKYYMTLALWRRIYQITSPREGSTAYDQLTGAIGDIVIPDDIQTYLDGIGDITDAEGQTWQFRVNTYPSDQPIHGGAAGSFGQVTAVTHVHYEQMPAPIIPLLAIEADILRTDHAGPQVWGLTAALTPANDGNNAPGDPTYDLVGYSYARLLTDEQKLALDSNNIVVTPNNTNFGVRNIHGIPVNGELISFITGQLKNSKCPAQTYTTVSTSGSLAQVPATERVSSDVGFNASKPIVDKLGLTRTYRQATDMIASSSATFRYRLMRKRNDHQRDSYCYTWDEGRHVPQLWKDNTNDTYDETSKWNISQFTLPIQDGKGIMNAFTLRTKKKVN